MKKFAEFKTASHDECEEKFNNFVRIFEYHVYKNGSYLGVFDDLCEALKTNGEINKVFLNEEEYKAIYSAWKKEFTIQVDLFHESLREEYSFLSDEIYNYVYNYAYDRYHSAGYDEVASGMVDLVAFTTVVVVASGGKLK